MTCLSTEIWAEHRRINRIKYAKLWLNCPYHYTSHRIWDSPHLTPWHLVLVQSTDGSTCVYPSEKSVNSPPSPPPASNIQICIPTCLYISPGGGARRVMARYVIIYCPPRLGDRYLDIFRHTLTSGRHFLGAATCYKYKYQACQLWNDLLATTLHCATNETLCCRLVSVKRCLTIPQLVDNIPSIKWRQLV